jgi:chromosome segregation ATPase
MRDVAKRNVAVVEAEAKDGVKALNAARADAVALATELAATVERNQTLERLARELRRRNDELERANATLMRTIDDDLKTVRERAEAQDAIRARAVAELALYEERQNLLETSCATSEERATQTIEAMAKMEELCDARIKIMEERQSALEGELEEARAEISKRLEREMELTTDLKTFGDKFEEFRAAVKTSESAVEGFQEEIARAKSEALSCEKAKLEAQLMKRKSDVALIEVVEERNALRERVIRLEKQNNSLEGLSRSLTERLKVNK